PSSCSATSTVGSGCLPLAFLRYTEQFPSAFKKKNVASSSTSPTGTGEQNVLSGIGGITYNTESGYTVGSPAGGTALPNPSVSSTSGTVGVGQADFGTRLKAVFNNIPAGVTLFVD